MRKIRCFTDGKREIRKRLVNQGLTSWAAPVVKTKTLVDDASQR